MRFLTIHQFPKTLLRSAPLALIAAVPSIAFAQGGLPNAIPAPPDSVTFGSSISSGGDANNDGCDDIFVVDSLYRKANGTTVGKWYMISGKTGRPLWSQMGAAPITGQRARHATSAFIGDVDDDDGDDVILGLPGLLDGRGGIAVLSGRTGTVLYYEIGDFAGAELGRDVGAAGDYNGDLIPDFAYVSNRNASDGGLVYVRSGADFSDRLKIGATQSTQIRRVSTIGDVEGRGGASVLYSQWDDTYSYPAEIVSQRDEFEIEPPVPSEGFGYQLTGGLDVTGDAVPDFAMTVAEGFGIGDVWIYSGQTLSPVHEIHRMSSTFGMTIDFADPNDDGLNEIVIGDADSMYVYQPMSNSLLHRVPASPNPGDSQLYGEEYAVGDVNGDGFDDYIAGVFENDVTEEQELRVYGGSGLFLHLMDSDLEISVDEEIQRGSIVEFEITGALPFRDIHLLASRNGAGCTYIERLESCVDLTTPILRGGSATTNSNGIARFELEIAPDVELGTVWLQAGDPAHYWLGPVKSNVLKLEIVE